MELAGQEGTARTLHYKFNQERGKCRIIINWEIVAASGLIVIEAYLNLFKYLMM